jgi:CheY-like chemotaxis protein
MKNACILHVEDEQADLELVQFAFKRAGITIPLQSVTDGQAAMDYLSGTGPFADRENYPLPCLILLDLKLPKVTGLEVLAWLRQQPQHKHTVVIVFSSSAHPGDVESAYGLGANSFVQKPSSLPANLSLAQALKAWWLDLNRFDPGCEPLP